ncbi:hypothetical protein A2852_00255 [Candidatus Adlerbacteria bacterium RIFCSPHIGHO2_01_FULL_54_23]|uniref:Bacterial spore germination immunoglobulin-like domain-containing protein n=3 Tax=Candidatus Adleribacteriota TaxID=1752736 RepID=A0A1F4XZS6_9BACT|nr:MAG: hypothetical protein UY83_C0007G0020 [Candidatus Adlerbacteria bacterium GW2011_GWA1_54_10]KKW38087.1 MAG: hypothetical protein UY86_C0001G0060 [Candidatus Adlerbacteria bacterium GW2011_GWB1_54_7]OGC78782.1 MAG: hypothetical protein A2852_00255 [Candidatus Adlerbacteria bacterium RIFCSPHIGHO2_01_FULL_54_23]OGC87108.1 MAG: hypothetical protein A3B33_00610 [Candidatus Adlerbacteria bacterium RIFCSPLOWO2_01_FULL_54_16]
MNRWGIIIALFVVIAAGAAALIILPDPVKAPTVDERAQKPDRIEVDTPRIGDAVFPPLIISGKARGNWYFEASFPIEIRNVAGEVIAQAPAQAQGEWMTAEFVPFYLQISFPPQPEGSKGNVVLKRDNPSGLPEYDEELVIPIIFQ